jgi:flagellar hook-length control protein FliK
MSPTAPQPIPTAPGGRQPISTGAPPGAPPEGPPFQSALETESARTAMAEGQQRNPSPAEGEQASAAEAFDRLPHGSAPPTRRHSGHRAAATPSGGKATAGLAPSSAITPTGPALTPAVPPRGSTPTAGMVPDAIAGGDANQGPAAPLSTGQPDPATARGGALAGGKEGLSGTGAAVAHDDALPLSPTSAVDGELAIARDGASTTGAPAISEDGTPTAGGSTSPLVAALKETPTAGGAQAHSTPAAFHARDLATALDSRAGANAGGEGQANAGGGGQANAGGSGSPTHLRADRTAGEVRLRPASDASVGDKLGGADPIQAATDGAILEGGSGGVGGLATTASPLLGAALDGSPAAPPAELGSGAYGVGLQEAIESLHGTIQLAARQGLTQARISLQPEELGEIRINLTQTAQGLLARVTAESPAAAQALAAAHAQLRQSLSSLGINLTRLDIGHHDPARGGGADAKGNGQGGAARGEGFSGGRPGRSTAIVTPADSEAETDLLVAGEPAQSTTAPSHGTLIDVLV